MAFGDKNKMGGGFAPKRGTFGTGLSKKNPSNPTGSKNGYFGSSNSNNSASGGGFGSKIKTSTFGNPTQRDDTDVGGQRHSNDEIPMLFRADIRDDEKPSAIKRTKIVTFSNVEWKKFDNIKVHPRSDTYHNEPPVHVIANRDNIEFHGYNRSEMEEGVYYIIGCNDNFEIECDVDTSQVLEHPKGYFYISFGIISAHIDHEKGCFFLDNKKIADVQKRFKMKLSLTNSGKYEVYIDDRKQGEEFKATKASTRIEFGFKHDAHDCEKISQAYLKRIKMKQTRSSENSGFGPSEPKSSKGFGIK